MNFFTNLWLPYMLLCYPYPTPHHLPLLRNARPLEIMFAAGAVSMAIGAPTSSAAEATGLVTDQIIAASKAPPSVIVDKVLGREIGSAVGGRIHAANYVKFFAIPLPTVLNSSSRVMATSLLLIWCSVISPQPVLLIGF
jgi:hypothetical protein